MYEVTYNMPIIELQNIFNFVSRILSCQFGLADRDRVLKRDMLRGKIRNIDDDFFKGDEQVEYGYSLIIGQTQLVILESSSSSKESLNYRKRAAFCEEDKCIVLVKIPQMGGFTDDELFTAISWIFGVILFSFSNTEKLTTYPSDSSYLQFGVSGLLMNVFAELTGLMSTKWEQTKHKEAHKIAEVMLAEGIASSNGSYAYINLSTYEKVKVFLNTFKKHSDNLYIE